MILIGLVQPSHHVIPFLFGGSFNQLLPGETGRNPDLEVYPIRLHVPGNSEFVTFFRMVKT